jgi:hypothetical protein
MTMPHRPPPAPPAKPLPKGLPPKPLPPGALPSRATLAPVAVPTPAPSGAPAISAALAPALRAASLSTLTDPSLHPIVAAMMEAIDIYRELLIQENALLRSGDSNGVAGLLDRKMSATQLYQDRQRSVLGDPEATRSLTADQRAKVVAMVRALEELASENTILLKANMSAIQQLFEVINMAARKMRKREVSYSQAGMIRDYHLAHNLSLAYNHVV